MLKPSRRIVTSRWGPLIFWSVGALFYIFQFLLRVSPGVMINELMRDFHATATQIGSFVGISTMAYALAQLPSGFLIDRLGPRPVILGAILLCIGGNCLIAGTDSYRLAQLGRVLIGLGSAPAFIAVGKIGSAWIAPQRRGLVFGLTSAGGTMGALVGSALLPRFVDHQGWRFTLYFVAALGVLILITAAKCLPKDHLRGLRKWSLSSYTSNLTESFRIVFLSSANWLAALSAVGGYLAVPIVADLWGSYYLSTVYALSRVEAARTTSIIYVGLFIGSLVLPSISDRSKGRAVLIRISLLVLAGLMGLLILAVDWPQAVLLFLFFLIGFFSAVGLLCYALATETSALTHTATVTGFINCLVMLGSAMVQRQSGILLDENWIGHVEADGTRRYLVESFSSPFKLTLGVILVSATFSFFLRDAVKTRNPLPV